MWRNREYKLGTKWCIFRWTDVDSEYIVRLHLIKTPWFAICLHWILKPDPEPWLHDHPVSFLSVILRGGYEEHRYRFKNLSDYSREGITNQINSYRKCGNLGVNKRRAKRNFKWYNYITSSNLDTHSIVLVYPNTLTLCFMGPKTREWGFHTNKGWIYWKDYYNNKKKEKCLK